MKLDGLELAELGTFQDRLLVSAYFRREQLRLFETIINVYVHAMTLNPDIVKRVQKSIDDYLDILVPGITEFRAAEQKNFVQQQAETLQNIFTALKDYEGERKSSQNFFTSFGSMFKKGTK